jgi:hypothetical protein
MLSNFDMINITPRAALAFKKRPIARTKDRLDLEYR